ncbi:MAG: hypothetical protein FWG79_08210 [Bacteroidales bacterium]|nr:hypothetical protein [Bacteroidales bacterium]
MWKFIIVEHKGRFIYGTPDIMDATKHSRNNVTGEEGASFKLGRNSITYKLEGNKLTITGGIEGTGGGFGAQIKNGVYYKYDPKQPKATENEMMREAGQGAAGLFGR